MSSNLTNLVAKLGELSDEEIVTVFQAVFSARPKATPEPWIRSAHYFVGIAYQLDESEEGNPPQWSSWKVSAIAKPDAKEYGYDASEFIGGGDLGFCQEGECSCGYTVCSNVKLGICQICGNNVGMT